MNIKNFNLIACIGFLVIGFLCLINTYSNTIADFGNYYYGSKLLINGLFTKEMYTSIYYFNSEIGKLGETNYFENYIPVPPISALFYAPFCFFKPLIAKLLFNVLSLIVFCFSLYKLLKFMQAKNPAIVLLPLLFLYPLYNNILQGQTYLLITSAIMLAYVYSQNNKTQTPAILLACCILLKLFPVFIMLYFLISKKYKIVAYTLCYVLMFFLITLVFIDSEIVIYYYTHVVPRLFNNDVVGTYSSINQSLYSMLLNVFTESSVEKIVPLINLPILVPIIESIFVGVVLYYVYVNKTTKSLFVFGLILFSSAIINRYNTTYSLVLLMPFLIYLLSEFEFKKSSIIILLLFFISVNIPVGSLIHYPVFIKFLRVIVFILLFILIMVKYKIDVKYKPLLSIILCVFIIKYFSFSIISTNCFETQNSKGILYDLDLKNDSLILKSTLGEKEFIEKMHLKGRAHFDSALICTNNILKFNNVVICNTNDNKLKPFIYNDSLIVFMSDLNQGVRFYKLRYITLNGK